MLTVVLYSLPDMMAVGVIGFLAYRKILDVGHATTIILAILAGRLYPRKVGTPNPGAGAMLDGGQNNQGGGDGGDGSGGFSVDPELDPSHRISPQTPRTDNNDTLLPPSLPSLPAPPRTPTSMYTPPPRLDSVPSGLLTLLAIPFVLLAFCGKLFVGFLRLAPETSKARAVGEAIKLTSDSLGRTSREMLPAPRQSLPSVSLPSALSHDLPRRIAWGCEVMGTAPGLVGSPPAPTPRALQTRRSLAPPLDPATW